MDFIACCPSEPIDEATTESGSVVVAPSTTVTVTAPPGKVGLVFFTNAGTGYGHEVKSVKETSLVYGKVLAGDVILSIDGEDTSQLDYNKIAELLLSKVDSTRVLKLKR